MLNSNLQQPFAYHLIRGQNGTTPVILLGGGPGFSSWNLQPIQQIIAGMAHDTYLMDMLGIGENRSALNKQQPVLEQWIAQIRALQLQASADQPVILVAHSWGALMAMLYTREYPEAVKKLVLLNPVDPEKKAMAQLTESIHERNMQLQSPAWDDEAAWENKTEVAEEDLEYITLRQIQQVLPTYFLDYKLGQKYAAQFTTDDFNIDLNVQAWREYDANPVTYAQINQWQLPSYFLECQQDYLMPFNLNAMQSKMRLQQVQVIEGCGHFPWIEQPHIFERHLQSFLQD
ncbi:hypothetical protein THMIRHAS_24120 [Thiosulfatimonas sediminis]|uniref:AB hydrolase-1 domain-containing protein n=1 Tax=Thiosulfatimonas sediminis TaxID=2675054 RepID=A0A6F8PY39_9GAMM|nr:alpha/beta hydrolase [Thiosulfatimonas sediminis]BBP47039.1 hypothetical protein THMIRHAS_24120 [Thiosulfatimonas sediminis]